MRVFWFSNNKSSLLFIRIFYKNDKQKTTKYLNDFLCFSMNFCGRIVFCTEGLCPKWAAHAFVSNVGTSCFASNVFVPKLDAARSCARSGTVGVGPLGVEPFARIGKHILGDALAFFSYFHGTYVFIIGLKALGNYSASIWINEIPILLLENQRTFISMTSGFLDPPPSLKTNCFYLWSHQDT